MFKFKLPIVSFRRRCPHCFGTMVGKQMDNRYFCNACDAAFKGFRIGFIRVSLKRG